MIPSLLSTKLFSPEMRENHVPRRLLTDKLIKGIHSGNRLTLISAPAGYGKTTLVLELLKSLNIASAWISLDESDNDIVQFLSYLIAAFKKAGAVIGNGIEEAALDFRLASTSAPLTIMINRISLVPEKMVLVLDDFHCIHSGQVIEAVRFLLEHQPPNLHLVIVTREDPPLPLPRIRAQGRIVEIRAADLSFTRDEAAEFFSRAMELKLSGKAVDAIIRRTEGWIAGLQLAGLSLKGCKECDVDEFMREFSDMHSYIVDYLVEEVISRQTREVREFLCKTSVLSRMNGGLCDAVTDRNDGRTQLREIEKGNLFLISLDSKREWYRYHHLFADSLRMELTKEEEKHLHRKAALWLTDNGFPEEALSHVFQSGDMNLALQLVESNMTQAFDKGKLTTFLKWVDMLPNELVRGSEILAVRTAWALLMIGKGQETHSYLNSLGADYLEKASLHNKGMVLSLRAVISQYSGGSDAKRQAEEALRYLDPNDTTMRAAALNTLGRAQEDNGETREAVGTLRLAYKECQK
jgi:LuxR family maltose regulon positive regulatory protein